MRKRLRQRWWRFLLDWLVWYGPSWLSRRVPDWGLYWEEVKTEDDTWYTTGGTTWRL